MIDRNECLLDADEKGWPNYSVPDRTAATLHPSDLEVHVVKMSQCGLTFTCQSSCEIRTSGLLDVSCGGTGFSLEEIPFMLLSETQREMGESRRTLEKGKQYNVRFTLFTRKQYERLRDFLDTCVSCTDAGDA